MHSITNLFASKPKNETKNNDLTTHVSMKMLNYYKKENEIMSPYSFLSALSALYSASGNETNKILSLFMNGVTSDDVLSSVKEVNKLIHNTAAETSNHLLVRSDIKIKNEFNKKINDVFQIKQLDVNNINQEVENINTLVNKNTHGKITKLLEPKDINQDTVCVILNVIYFKSFWKIKFNKKYTKPTKFNNCKMVDMMNIYRNDYRYISNGNYQMVELDYMDQNFCMGFVLPKVGKKLVTNMAEIDNSLLKMSEVEIETLSIPKFKSEKTYDLSEFMGKNGLKDLFKTCDLSTMTDHRQNIYLSKAIQKAIIEVDEDGTEAAAATGFCCTTECYIEPQPPINFIADRSFTYFIRHKPTNAKLFVGIYQT